MKNKLQSLGRIQVHIRTHSVVIRLDFVIPAALVLYLAFSLAR